MSALIALVADLLELPPAVVAVVGVGLIVLLLQAAVREWIRYLGRCDDNLRRYQERRSQDRLIEKMIEGRVDLEPAVIQAIRGTAIADAATAGLACEVVDAEVDGLVRRLTGWMRELKLPGG